MESSPGAAVVPIIRRARGYRLYDSRGSRYLDLCRDGGGALLGHRAATTVTLMKSVLSQGLAAGVPSVWETRLVKLIASFFPSHRAVRLFSSPARALEAASQFLGEPLSSRDVHDPAVHGAPQAAPRASRWRPFLPECEQGVTSSRVVLPVLPLTVCGAPAPVCLPEEPSPGFPASDCLPGFLLAGALSALAQVKSAPRQPFRVSPGVEKAVDAAPGWKRAGPYVHATFDPARYPRVFLDFLQAGVLLCPVYPGPSILPGECSPGEARRLAELFTTIPGG